MEWAIYKIPYSVVKVSFRYKQFFLEYFRGELTIDTFSRWHLEDDGDIFLGLLLAVYLIKIFVAGFKKYKYLSKSYNLLKTKQK